MSLPGNVKQLKLILMATLLLTGFGFITMRASDKNSEKRKRELSV